MYKRYIPDDDDNVDHIYAICGELPKDVKSGSILICCPQANPIKDIVLPNDCIAIAGSAFYGCKLTSLYIPDSLKATAIAAFAELEISTIYVPDKYVNFAPEHNNINEKVTVLANNPFAPELKYETELFWRCIFNEEVYQKNTSLFELLFPNDRQNYDTDLQFF